MVCLCFACNVDTFAVSGPFRQEKALIRAVRKYLRLGCALCWLDGVEIEFACFGTKEEYIGAKCCMEQSAVPAASGLKRMVLFIFDVRYY